MSATVPQTPAPKILILASLSGGYAGADSVGQLHVDYAANVYILPTVCPAMFPPEFYLRTFAKGMDAILVMYSGTDCPYKGGAERTATLINEAYPRMKAQGIDPRRLRLVAICTVCTKPFLQEVASMNRLLLEIGPVRGKMLPEGQAQPAAVPAQGGQ